MANIAKIKRKARQRPCNHEDWIRCQSIGFKSTAKNAIKYVEVTHDKPCAICQKDNWCSRCTNGQTLTCNRTHKNVAVEGWEFLRVKSNKDGQTYSVWRKTAPTATAHRVYELLLQCSPLIAEANKHLRKRGLSLAQIGKLGYGYLGNQSQRQSVVDTLIGAGLKDELQNVPGFYFDDNKQRWKISGARGIMIPVRNASGEIIAITLRHITAKPKSKYTSLSSKSHGGKSPGSLVHVPTHRLNPVEVRITEGHLKADVATLVGDVLTLGLPGLYGGDKLLSLLNKLSPTKIRIAFDSDFKQNGHVARALAALYRQLANKYATAIETWEKPKGIDDLLLTKRRPKVLCGDEAEELIADIESEHGKFGCQICVELDELSMNNKAIVAITQHPDLYVRSGEIVSIVPADEPPSSIIRPNGLPRIKAIPEASLREILSHRVTWLVTDHEGKQIPTRIPSFVTKAILHRGVYPEFRQLEGIVTGPILRTDGSVLSRKGYDRLTGYYLTDDFNLDIPNTISQTDIEHAKEILLRLVSDFPFGEECHRSVWLAFLFTMLSRVRWPGLHGRANTLFLESQFEACW